jgi:hypothetical protein
MHIKMSLSIAVRVITWVWAAALHTYTVESSDYGPFSAC